MVEKLDKAALLAAVRDERARLMEQLSHLSSEQWLLPGASGHWSPKDVLAHIIFWEEHMLRIANDALNGVTPTLLPPDTTEADVARINDQAYRAQRDRPLEAIQAEAERSFAQVLATLELLSEDELTRPDYYPWMAGEPFWRLVDLDTANHYYQHRLWLETFLASQEH